MHSESIMHHVCVGVVVFEKNIKQNNMQFKNFFF